MADIWRESQRFLARFLTPGVRWIFVSNVAVFIAYALLTPFSRGMQDFFYYLMQTPSVAIGRLWAWQFLTYMFMHAGVGHLLINMLILWFFAPRLEALWGTLKFLRFYLIVGIGAGFFHAIVSYATGNANSTMLGASGAIYGVLLAYALNWPNDTVLLYFLIPVKIKYLMIGLGIFTFFASIPGELGGGVSHITHLGGLLAAFIYFQFDKRGGPRRRTRIETIQSDWDQYFRR